MELTEIGFEIIGDIAIIEDIKGKLNHENIRQLGEQIMKENPHINIIALKISDVEGTYRVANHKIVMKRNRDNLLRQLPKKYRDLKDEETLHKEHGVRVLLNINTVYFSSKLGFERKRIKEQVKENEKIFLPFAGVGIYGLVIAKEKKVDIDAIEINPEACKYMEINLTLNKLKGNISPYCMDVKEFIKSHNLEKYDRIIMPAPKDAPTYFNEITSKAKRGTYIHYYFFENKEHINIHNLKEKFSNYPLEIINFRKAGSVGVNTYRVVVDFIKL